MATKLLHSLTDDNIELQKQLGGCMTGIFQLFDRQNILPAGSRRTPRRLSPSAGICSDTFGRECNSAQLRSASRTENYSDKNIQEKQRISSELSRPSFSSSSRSSSFSSVDCTNRTTQLEPPASFDRIIFPETPSKDPAAMSLQNSSPQFTRQSRDLRDFVKDSMYRETQGLSIKTKTAEEAADPVMKYRDSPKIDSKITDGSCVSGLDMKQRESLRVLPGKLQEPYWHHNEPRGLLRSSSCHSKDRSSFMIPRDAPRFSYDGNEVNRAPFDSWDVSKSSLKLKDLPRLSLDRKAGSMRSLHADSKSNYLKSMPQDNDDEFDCMVRNSQESPGNQARPPSVVAKLMGLETLPDSVSSVQPSSSSKNLWKQPSSPRWRNLDSSIKPWFPIEPAPWKQIDGRRSSQKPGTGTTRALAKAEAIFPSVYTEIDKRLKDLEFAESGKDLRALKQILEAMQSKGFLQTQDKDHERAHLSYKHEARSSDRQKRRNIVARHMESPIVIMKPAKLLQKSHLPAASVNSLDGLSCGINKLRDNEFVDDRKGFSSSSSRTAKDLRFKSSKRDNAANMKNDRTLKTTQPSTRPQQSAKDSNAGSEKTSGSISPRMQQKKLELEKRSRPPTSPDSSKSRRHPNKQEGELNSPGGRRRPKQPNIQETSEKLSEVHVESRKSNYHEDENSVQSNALVATSGKSSGIGSCESPSMKASDFDLSGLVEKNSTLALSEEKSAAFGFVPPEYSSPVSVLDNIVHKDDSPSLGTFVKKTIKVDVTMDKAKLSNAVQGSSEDIYIPNSKEYGSASEINRDKLQNIDNLVQKLRRLNSSHDEARTDYIASLCDNTDPDHRYISEILLASGLLLRDLGSSLTSFEFHPSGHAINPELFVVLEQTKSSTFRDEECSNENKTGKCHRKLIFDTVNEILARKLASTAGSLSEPWLRPVKVARIALNAQKLLRELCSDIEVLGSKNHKCDSDEEDERWKSMLCEDVMHHHVSESWISFHDEISGAVLDIERSLFKDLVDEIVIGESAGLKTKPRRLFA